MEITIPKFLRHLPVWHGYPVLFTALWVGDAPDFRATDHAKVRRCVLENLCAICGKELGLYKWFVGGPMSLEESSMFADPPQHEKCARFAIGVCPFLSGKTTESNRSRPIPEGLGDSPLVTPARSAKIGMRKCKFFELVNVGGHALMRVQDWGGKSIWLA